VALNLAGEGAMLVLAGRTESKLREVQREVEAKGGAAEVFSVDVADHDGVQSMVQAVRDQHGRIDLLVNSAGGGAIHKRTLTTTPEDIRRNLDTNLVGTIYCTQAVLPAMLEAKSGTIINVSSGAARNPGLLGGMIYGASKAGVNNFTAFVNTEFRNSGVRCSVVIPGEVDTPALTNNRPIPPSQEARQTMLQAEDVAEAIVLIAKLPQRAHIQEVVIRPTMSRDTSAETPPA
jgi:NADP-dependent 3-hydroxy acid dehydrogenase YdfG